MPGTPFPLEVTPQLPPRLRRLEELSNNLWYSWHRPTRLLFHGLHPTLYRKTGHSGEFLYVLDLTPELCGRIDCRLRMYPSHEMLTHPFEMGMMVWL